MVAAFFTAFPEEAEKYKEELEAYWEEQERQQRARETRLTPVYLGNEEGRTARSVGGAAA